VTDNYFTSPELGAYLLSKDIYLTGTIRTNRKGLPNGFVKEKLEVELKGYQIKNLLT
jgi:hypothetical protein